METLFRIVWQLKGKLHPSHAPALQDQGPGDGQQPAYHPHQPPRNQVVHIYS